MNAIPLINNAPRPNINIGSIGSPAFNPVAADAKLGGSIGGNVMRQNPASMPVNNETQLRQEVNTSIIALKREAFSLENLIAQAAQTLQDINKRLSELEGKQDDYVKKADATVESVGGSGKYISAISETDGKISATATDLGNMVPVDTVTSGNMHSVTSNAVSQELNHYLKKNTFTTFKLLTPGYSRYILIADVSTWYNSTSPNVTQTYTMVGLLLSYRGSGNDRTECAMITLSVGYYRANNPLPANNLMNVKMVGVNGLYYRCCIIRYNNKEYLAIKLLTDQSRYNQFIGYITDTPLYTVLDANTSVTELYVN